RLVFFDLGHYHVDTLPAPSRVNSRVVDVSSSLARRGYSAHEFFAKKLVGQIVEYNEAQEP
ncbi:hypothetical protein VSX64_25800, partial [Aurantimonas sp. C2-6-R+9]|uniref:hypothetical protein n=1 Tax=Aurantimonas sp. C2-6-R+9 TaxID=3114365 RepID=UPI002E188C70|nr:hypothetical protein [Aurantimonas sp. C2-6-R+9]